MRIAVVFDTLYDGWEDEDFKKEVTAEVEEPEYEVAEALMANDHTVLLVGVHDDLTHLITRLQEFEPDLVFNCAEGFHGESRLDYVFPAVLEAEGFPYTGTTPMGLLISRNKGMSKKLLGYHGIRVPEFVTYRMADTLDTAPDLRFPLIVKPLQEDASAGIAKASVVHDFEHLAERVIHIRDSFGQPAIAEEFIEGRELYVSVLGNGTQLETLPIVEMVFDKNRTTPHERIATKSAKWDVPYRERKGIRNVFARPIAQGALDQIDNICRMAFRALWLRDYARLDVRLTSDNEVWVIEANANPFISFGHDMANAAEKAGMDYYAFVERLITIAMERHDPEA
jgi:D-alanine-D-alanine ligase